MESATTPSEGNKEDSSSVTNAEKVSEIIELAAKIEINKCDVETASISVEQQQLECERQAKNEELTPIPTTNDTELQDKQVENKQVTNEIAIVGDVEQKTNEISDETETIMSFAELKAQDEVEEHKDTVLPAPNDILSHVHCLAQLEEQRRSYERQLEQLRTANTQKDNMMTLLQRENAILDKEKLAFRHEMDVANKEKEATVIKFAMKEKLLIDAKKEKELVEKQLADAKREVKNVSIRFHAVNEEKSRITYIIDEKCNEVRKYQRECEKLKTEMGHLESKLKYHANKLNIEVEAKASLERKLEEERNAPNKLEEKANEKLKMEFEANTILLKHEIMRKTEALDKLTKEQQKQAEAFKELQQQLQDINASHGQLTDEFKELQEQHSSVEAAYSDELLKTAKLHGQVAELQLLRTQNTINEEKLAEEQKLREKLEANALETEADLEQLQQKKQELLSINKEMSEVIVQLQNNISLAEAKAQGLEAENKLMKQEKHGYDIKYGELENQLSVESAEKNEERLLLAKHLSEKTKLYELTKAKLDNVQGDFEATQHKQATLVKELQRELQKYKRGVVETKPIMPYCSNCQQALNGYNQETPPQHQQQPLQVQRTHSRSSSHGSSRRASESSESETVASSVTTTQQPQNQAPPELQAVLSKKVLVERILRLQQATARQTERIEFLENHTAALVAEVQKKSKVVQHYMLRDQTAGALTTTKSDQNKSELVKYGNGVMAAIYGGVKGAESKGGMSLDLSLEINKKLQTVLEDTLLKNITLKENLDVLGLEVDNLTRKLRNYEQNK
ncbi:coiled-coil domain-containing protein 186 [Drosophila nasuta]|uniref:coiled-coil domain-containing protein 186 n=1 Tax=Drosophila nasuta TaxID=42062 RepID=UPI00295E80B4|nr:coiled-coil domain-containing protein 186 [Drosophila nasuta]